ncbi:MAG: mannose-6-phosphate isomerase-like protein (cupin superfamily) [Hyphomicrobiaceae bacterium]|jgi:mannose-6-phosphate isomerase-like protein (cupin superfamily)
MMQSVNLVEKLASFSEHWSPRIVSSFNGHDVMVAKLKGEYVWHAHADTDDLFLVLKGSLRIETEDGTIHLNEGDLHVVPKGVRHCPVADEEAHVLLIETAGEPNSGDSVERAPATKIAI